MKLSGKTQRHGIFMLTTTTELSFKNKSTYDINQQNQILPNKNRSEAANSQGVLSSQGGQRHQSLNG